MPYVAWGWRKSGWRPRCWGLCRRRRLRDPPWHGLLSRLWRHGREHLPRPRCWQCWPGLARCRRLHVRRRRHYHRHPVSACRCRAGRRRAGGRLLWRRRRHRGPGARQTTRLILFSSVRVGLGPPRNFKGVAARAAVYASLLPAQPHHNTHPPQPPRDYSRWVSATIPLSRVEVQIKRWR